MHGANNISRHSYFNRIPHLWNALPMINLNYSHDTIIWECMNVAKSFRQPDVSK